MLEPQLLLRTPKSLRTLSLLPRDCLWRPTWWELLLLPRLVMSATNPPRQVRWLVESATNPPRLVPQVWFSLLDLSIQSVAFSNARFPLPTSE